MGHTVIMVQLAIYRYSTTPAKWIGILLYQNSAINLNKQFMISWIHFLKGLCSRINYVSSLTKCFGMSHLQHSFAGLAVEE
jgi:hypothetical protein